MRIGLDIDNVITDFDKTILEEFFKEDKNKRNNGIVNANSRHITKGMFDWSNEEVEDFFCKNMENMAKILEPRIGVKYYMDKMIEDGHELYLISHRAYPHYNNPYETTIEWLEKNNINYTKLVLSKSPDKTDECNEYDIDIMVDDRVGQCKKMMDKGVKCIVMLTRYNYEDVKGIESVNDFKDLYRRIK